MTNQEFKEKFNFIVNTKDDKIKLLDNLIEEASNELVKESILDKEDFYNLSKKELENRISNLIYKCENGSMLMINHRLRGYCYNNGWIDIGYLYNIIKGSMNNNLNNLSSCTDYYRNIIYLLNHSELESIILLKVE